MSTKPQQTIFEAAAEVLTLQTEARGFDEELLMVMEMEDEIDKLEAAWKTFQSDYGRDMTVPAKKELIKYITKNFKV